MIENNMPIGINPIIINDKNEILLGRRKNCYGEELIVYLEESYK